VQVVIEGGYKTTRMNYKLHSSIKELADDEQPRQKLLLKGKNALSDAELLAILIGSGTKEESALGLSGRMLLHVKQNLFELGKLSLKDFLEFKGIGQAKALLIVAALEIGRRRQFSQASEKVRVQSSRDAYEYLFANFADLKREEFWIILLNRSNKILDKVQISVGGISGTVVDTRIIFQNALQRDTCTSIILAHNHPSGNLKPSQADIDITKKITKGGNCLELKVLDHLIFSEEGYYSFADEGRMM